MGKPGSPSRSRYFDKPSPEIHRRRQASCGGTDVSTQPGASLLHRPASTRHALGARTRAQLASRPAGPGKRGPPRRAAPGVFGPPRSAPRRREASAARPQMSLPLRLPYCYPTRPWRGALRLAYICTPVMPPLSPAVPRCPPPASLGSAVSTEAALWRAAQRRLQNRRGASPLGWASRC